MDLISVNNFRRKRSLRYFALLFFFLMMCPSMVSAQNTVTIGGTVSSKGEPLIGAVVKEKGTTKATATNIDGVYSLTVQENAILEISYVGYKTKEIKVNGQKMCDLARKGKADTVEIKPRKVNIEKIEILNINDNKILFLVKCSKGTYVRSICHDIGEYLKCGGHMSFLLRTSSGRFNLENSITLEELEQLKENGCLEEHLYDIDYVLNNLQRAELNPSAKKYYINGGAIDSRRFAIKKSKDNNNDDNLVRVYCEDIFVGVGKIIKDNNTMMLKSDKLFI